MAKLTNSLVRLLQRCPKHRLKGLVKVTEWEAWEDGITPIQEPVSQIADENDIADKIQMLDNSDPEVDYDVLIPGLPNEVVMEFVITKLPWRTLYTVSLLSKTWLGICRRGEVHEARLRTGNTESLVAMTHAYPDPEDRIFQRVCLYDPAGDSWHLLPPLPRVMGGISSKYECAIVEGRLYIIGGLSIDSAAVSWKAVLMLDLSACRGVWNQCASMELSRSQFACQVKDSKIYVFGGVDEQDRMLDGADVYDPVKNQWSRVASMGYKRSNHKAICLDDNLYLCGGNFWCDTPGVDLGNDHEAVFHRQACGKKRAQDADFMEMYDATRYKWLTVANFTKGRNPGSCFVVGELLYNLNHESIDSYDKQSNSWKSFQLESWSSVGASEICAIAVVKRNIFAMILERREDTVANVLHWPLLARYNVVAIPVRAAWSEARSTQLDWQKMKCPYDFNWSSCSIHPLQL